jgi:hypothetical protein
MNKPIFIIAFILIVFIASCKQLGKITEQQPQKTKTDKEIENIIFNGTDEIKTLKLTKVTFRIKINDELYESGGNIAIFKDSVIIISLIPLLGYEIARVYCFQENMLIIDRQQKQFYYIPYANRIANLDVRIDFNDIESILTGRAFIYEDHNHNYMINRNLYSEKGYWRYKFEMKEGNLLSSQQEILVNADNYMTEKNEISDLKNKLTLIINYKEFKNIDSYLIPSELHIKGNSENDEIDILLSIGDVVTNKEINTKIVLPENYREKTTD